MLEEILKSINSNLERIAKALEVENVDAVVDMVHETAKQFGQTETTLVIPQAIIPQAPVAEVPQQPIQHATPQTIPTTQVQENFTLDQLAVAMSNAVNAGKMPVIQGILQQFGVQALTQINPNDYNKLATMLKEAGVEV